MQLRPYQEQAADFLYERDRAMILAPVGAGKTAITLSALRPLLQHGHAHRALVLAPLRVAQHVWATETRKWAPQLSLNVACGDAKARAAALKADSDIVVTNYDALQWLAEQPDLDQFDVVVFDELTRLKNPSGKRFKALEKILKTIPKRWGLTGSFTSNGLEDVFGQCKVIDQSLLGRSKGAFMQTYFWQDHRGAYTEWTPRVGALGKVMERIKPATFLLEPGQYKDKLPPLHTVTMPCRMDMTAYDTMKKDMVLQFADETAVAQNAAVVTQKLQQISSGFLYTDSGPRWMSKHKFDLLDEILDENQGANTIVVYNYVEELAELRRRHPGLAAFDEKWDIVSAWNAGRVRLLAAHPRSAGHGLNLQSGGHHIVWLSLPWSLELYEQTIGRLHRSGQTREVWNYVIQTEGTIDTQILAALTDKRTLSDLAIEALK